MSDKQPSTVASILAKMPVEQLADLVVDLDTKYRQAVARIVDLEGRMDRGQLVGRPEAIINTAAKVAHEINRAYCKRLGDDSQVPWSEAPDWQRASCAEGVKAIAKDPGITPEVSHALWCRHKKADGWTFGEVKDEKAKTHPCLVPYSDLSPEQQMKDTLFGAAVRAVLGV